MPFTEFETARIEAAMSGFMAKHRPPPEIRDKLDLAYRIEGQSVVIFEIRPFWRDPGETIEEPAAKATFVRKTDRWKIYWQRSDLKWHAYPPHPEALFFDEFLAIVDEDEHCCFWG
jgi:hypothetical protein